MKKVAIGVAAIIALIGTPALAVDPAAAPPYPLEGQPSLPSEGMAPRAASAHLTLSPAAKVLGRIPAISSSL